MGRHSEPTDMGSRRAAVLTLTASALLVIGGFVVLAEADGVRDRPAQPATPTVPAVVPSDEGHAPLPSRP